MKPARGVQTTWIDWGIVICISFSPGLLWAAADVDHTRPVEMSQKEVTSHQVVTGTLTTLDFKTGKGLVQDEMGKPVYFEIVRPDIFRTFSIGQHVSIGLNEKGQAIKVMETPPIELPAPLAPARK
ncbi:MAG: hypothetical protein QM706_08015 [Nitrospira sp.]